MLLCFSVIGQMQFSFRDTPDFGVISSQKLVEKLVLQVGHVKPEQRGEEM